MKITYGDVFVFNSSNPEQVKQQHWEHYLFKNDATGCYFQGGLNISYTAVSRHVDVYKVSYASNAFGGLAIGLGVVCGVTTIAGGLRAYRA